MNEAELEELTYRHLPRGFLRDLTRSVFVAHRSAWEHCHGQFARPEAENLVGYTRRAHVESMLRGVSERHEIPSEVIKEPRQPWNHTEVRSGPVTLTASSVQAPLEMVDPADYRLALAEGNQTRLELFEGEPTDGALRLFVLLLHSRSYWRSSEEERIYGRLPGSIYLAYPGRDLDYYVHSINLFTEFPDVVQQETPQEWDEQALLQYVERSRRVA